MAHLHGKIKIQKNKNPRIWRHWCRSRRALAASSSREGADRALRRRAGALRHLLFFVVGGGGAASDNLLLLLVSERGVDPAIMGPRMPLPATSSLAHRAATTPAWIRRGGGSPSASHSSSLPELRGGGQGSHRLPSPIDRTARCPSRGRRRRIRLPPRWSLPPPSSAAPPTLDRERRVRE